jgi:CRISPR/Cas system CMR subunit Cmr4 (Cas7 group RAMP superfamily)
MFNIKKYLVVGFIAVVIAIPTMFAIKSFLYSVLGIRSDAEIKGEQRQIITQIQQQNKEQQKAIELSNKQKKISDEITVKVIKKEENITKTFTKIKEKISKPITEKEKKTITKKIELMNHKEIKHQNTPILIDPVKYKVIGYRNIEMIRNAYLEAIKDEK